MTDDNRGTGQKTMPFFPEQMLSIFSGNRYAYITRSTKEIIEKETQDDQEKTT